MQDYKSLLIAVTICANIVSRHSDRHTAFDRVILLAQPAEQKTASIHYIYAICTTAGISCFSLLS